MSNNMIEKLASGHRHDSNAYKALEAVLEKFRANDIHTNCVIVDDWNHATIDINTNACMVCGKEWGMFLDNALHYDADIRENTVSYHVIYEDFTANIEYSLLGDKAIRPYSFDAISSYVRELVRMCEFWDEFTVNVITYANRMKLMDTEVDIFIGNEADFIPFEGDYTLWGVVVKDKTSACFVPFRHVEE